VIDLWQPVAKHLLFGIQAWREHSDLPAQLRELEASQRWSRERLDELQRERLRAILLHAGRHSPFWSRRFAAAAFDPAGIRGLEDLRRLPTLTKRDLQQHHQEMQATVHPGRLHADKTGGSTGEPVRFSLDSRRYYYRHAVALRHDRWTGWDIGEKVAYIWGHRDDLASPAGRLSRLRGSLLDRRIFLDSSTLSRLRLETFRERLLGFRPRLIVGYANSLHLFARFLAETAGGRYHRPGAIISSAEYLEPTRRALIEDVFGCRVYDRYGSRETGLVASQCNHGEGLHLAAESLVLEILRGDDRPAEPGQSGRVVVTDLLNFGMPLIRYEIRDVAAPLAGECPCGRSLPRVTMEGGRVSDFVVTADGTIVSGTALTIFLAANAPGVAQAQLLQRVRGEVTVRLVAGEGYGPQTEAFFARELPRFFGTGMRWTVESVPEIPLAASGKHRFCISEVDPAEAF
jgi:phenylacetate-CoA ligase